MITCPHCCADLECFEVYTLYGLTGSRMVADCDECDKPFNVDVLVQESHIASPAA